MIKVCQQHVELLERGDCDQHDLSSKPTRAILLCPWERHFTSISPAVLTSGFKFQSYHYKIIDSILLQYAVDSVDMLSTAIS